MVDFDMTFAEKWNEAYDKGQGIKWIARELHISPTYVGSVKRRLRRQGIFLPTLTFVNDKYKKEA